MTEDGWKPVDLDLTSDAWGLHPRVSPTKVAFSADGSGSLAALNARGHGTSLFWPVRLAAPVVSGPKASYDLGGGATLELVAQTEGFEASMVLSKQPVKAPVYKLPLAASGLTATTRADGAVVLKDADGDQMFEIAPARMWDSRTDEAGDPSNFGNVDMTLSGAGANQVLTINPSWSFLTDPTTVYPVTVDPTVTAGRANDTYVSSAAPNTTYGSDYRLRAGYDGTSKYRSLVDVDFPAAVLGTQVTAATLKFDQYWAPTCTAKGMDVFPLSADWSGPTWNTQPAINSTYKATASFNHGAGTSCPGALATFDVKNIVSSWASRAIPEYGFELRASGETDSLSEKRFCSVNYDTSLSYCNAPGVPGSGGVQPTLSITYNHYPATPTSVTTSPLLTGTTGKSQITSLTPTFSAVETDVDPATVVQVQFEISYDPAFNDGSGVITTGASAWVPAGSPATWTAAAGTMPSGKHIRWRAWGWDGLGSSGWSGYQYGLFNTASPPAPVLDCPSYPANAWSSSAGSVTCTVKSTAAADISGFYWTLDDPTVNADSDFVAGSAGGVTSNLTINPASGWHILYARAQDVAYHLSASTTAYSFGVNTGALTSPADGDTTQQAVSLTAKANPTEDGVSYNYRIGTTGTWTTVPAGDVTVPGSGDHPSWPQAMTPDTPATSSVSSALSWNLAKTVTDAGGDDGPVQLQACFSHAGTADGCSPVETLILGRKAFGNAAATTDFGPGTLALVTGDLDVDATDVSITSPGGGLSFGRSLTTLGPSTTTSGATGVFGPAWTASLPGPDSGAASLALSTHVTDGYATLTDAAGVVYTYTTKNTASPWTFTGLGDANDGSTLVRDDSGANPTATLTDPDGTKTTWSWHASTSAWQITSVNEPGSHNTTSYTFDGSGRVTRVLAPVPAGVDCANPTTTKGCRTLDLTYATSTTATADDASGWGDSTGRITSVGYTAWDPAANNNAGGMTTTTVAGYAYDTLGLLRAAWDPRITPALKTTYSYTADTTVTPTVYRLATVNPAGLNGTTINYDDSHRVASASWADPANGTATRAVAYDVPITGTAAPIDMSSGQTSQWAQVNDVPYTGTAVFRPDHVPAAGSNGDYAPTAEDWKRASLTYMDVNGRSVNTAAYGAGDWQITTGQYDQHGNVYFDLSAGNRAQALTPTADTDPAVAALSSSSDRAVALASFAFYTSDGVDLTHTYGPTHPVTLDDGSLHDARDHVHYLYDEGAPSGGPYHLITTATEAAWFADGASGVPIDHDTRTTKTGYDSIVTGDTSGWTLRQPTTQTVVMPGGTNIVSTTRYDVDGNAIETRMPAGAGGSDAHSSITTYYTADGSAAWSTCRNHAEWAGLPCRVDPAAQPTTGPTLPTPIATYTYLGAVGNVSEYNGVTLTRSTTSTFDSAGRPLTVSISDTTGATAVATQTTSYDSSTGLPTTVSDGTRSITTGYDALGRVTSYTVPAATGTNTTTTTYDIAGRPRTVDDGKGTTTYTYDGTDSAGQAENRGLPTRVDADMGGKPSIFTGAYDSDGKLISQAYPNGVAASTDYDNVGQPTHLIYTQGAKTLAEFSDTYSTFGQVRGQASTGSSQTFSYDSAQRLTEADDTANGTCTIRKYGYDTDSNRTSLKAYPADTTGACSAATTPLIVNHGYDQADRLADTGYNYDNLGRTLAVPGSDTNDPAHGLTIGYFANDIVHTQTQNGATRTWTLDPAERLWQQTNASTGVTETSIYRDGSDSAAWTQASDATWNRDITDLAGNLAGIQSGNATGTVAVTLQLTNLHGDNVATIDDTTGVTTLSSYGDYSEFGAPQSGDSPTYGWLGSKQRSAGDLGGLTLMGVRLYNPATGRFLQTDPVPGGSANDYDYAAQDPVNLLDLDGRMIPAPDGDSSCRCTSTNVNWSYVSTYYDSYSSWQPDGNDWRRIITGGVRKIEQFATGYIGKKIGISPVKVDYGLFQERSRMKHVVSRRCHNNHWQFRSHNIEQWGYRIQLKISVLNFFIWSAKRWTIWFYPHQWDDGADYGFSRL